MNATANPVIVVAPDSFKGSLSAHEAADAMERGIRRAMPSCTVRSYPMADGGEGTLRALLRGGGTCIPVMARDAAGIMREIPIGLLSDGSAAIEIAEIVGLTDLRGTLISVAKRTTLGVGDAICALLDRGVKKIIIALGGSSTNDGGAGMLVALGAKLRDQEGVLLDPIPEVLGQVAQVDLTGMNSRLAAVDLLVLSDVDNPLTGQHGATAVFGPQKGVPTVHVARIDFNIAHYAGLLEGAFNLKAKDIPGSGAAGGLGFAFNLLGARVQSGAETVADMLGIDQAMVGADWVITGEGRSDGQTLRGKAPYVVCQRARQAGAPTTLLSGAISLAESSHFHQHFSGCFSLVPGPMNLAVAISQAGMLLGNAAEQVARLWAATSIAKKSLKVHV